MAGSLNKVMLIGNLGADPEVRNTASGQMVATLSIATGETYTDREGKRQERTEWHRVVVWGKSAELAERYLKKGRKVYVEGRLQTRSWDDPNGQKRYSTEIVANQLTFLDSAGGGAGEDAGAAGGGGGGRGGYGQRAGGGGGGYGGGGAQGGGYGGGGAQGGGYGGGGGGAQGGGYGGGGPAQGGGYGGGRANPAPAAPGPVGGPPPGPPDGDFFDDDIPF